MSTVAPNPPAAPGSAPVPGGKLVEYDQYIDTQLRRTRGQVKIAEVCSGLMSLGVAALAFFLVVALADHWLIRGGFGAVLRFALFAALVLGAGYYFVQKILPALLGRVNPVYAAQTIERSKPTLKNSLINFLLFRQKPESVPGVVYKALQEQAATGLTRVSIESAVDRTRMIRLGYVLIAFLTAFVLYFVLSPKNPFVSAQRIILPWTDVPAPSRVSIQDIQPREATIFRGQSLEVSAIIDGLAGGDVPQVLYTTADRQIVDRGIPLTVPQGYRHVASVPESKEGLQQDVAYRIEAGDAISGTFHVHVIDAPTIVVDRIEYKYPAYAGREPNPFTVEHRGDIKELEGTQVTIHATANQPIKSGFIDLGCDRKADVKLKIDGKTAKAGFVLSLDKDRKGPLFDSYQLLITNDRNMENAQPIKHRIEVIADLAPEVAILAPEREEVSVPLDGQVTIELRARDPDFALSGVRLKAKTARDKVLDENLLTDAPHQGPFTTKYQFVPAKLGLKPGDVVAYQAIATDNKTPEANETATSEKRIKIAAPQNPNPPPQANQPQNGGQNNQPNNQKQNNDRQGGQSKNQDNKSDKGQSKGNDQQRGNQQEQNNDQKQGADQKQQGRDQQRQNDQGGDQQKQGADQQKQNGDQQKQNGNQPGSDQQHADGQKQQGDSKQQDNPQKDDGQKQSGDGQQGKGDNSPQDGQSKDNSQQQSGGTAGKSEGAKGGQQGDRSNQDQSKNDAQGGGQHDQSDGSQNQSNSSQQQPDGKSSDSSGQPNKDQGQEASDKGQAKGKGQSAKDQSQSRAPADGQDDGNALERILNHDQKDKPQDGQKGQSTSGQNNQSSGDQKNQSAQSRDDQKRDSTQPGDQQKQPGEGQHSQQQTGDGQQAKDKGQGTKDQQAQNADGQKRDSTQPGDQQKQSSGSQDSKQQTGDGQAKDKGQGTKDQTAKDQQATKPQADQNTKSDQGAAGDQNQKKDGGSQGNPPERPSMNQDKTGAEQSPSASRDNSNSSSGAGQKNQDGQGSPENQRDAKPRDKTPDPSNKSSEKSDAQSPGTSQHESDSHGDQDGDQAGGGQSGGGQKADKPGKGQSGQNTASDQGAGKASEPGKGEDSNNPGTDKKSDQATGRSGTEKGNGSKSQAGQKGDDQGQKDQGQGASDKSQGTNDQGQKKGEQGERTNRGGGSGNSGNIDGSPPTAADKLNGGAAAPTEDPNLAYAKKATELALDRLKKALKASENDNLLRDLGWSRAEAEEFVKRQEERLQNANLSNRNDDRRRQAEDDLRSLGLRPDRTNRAGGNVASDSTRGLSSDRRTAPPPEYAQQFKAYQQGVNQSSQNGK